MTGACPGFAFLDMFVQTLMRSLLPAIVPPSALASAQAPSRQLKTTTAVLDRYKKALGGAGAIQKVQWETVHGGIEATGVSGKATFVHHARGFMNPIKVTRPDGSKVQSGFDSALPGLSPCKPRASTKIPG